MQPPDQQQAFSEPDQPLSFTKADFGEDFKWGVATAAIQIEGAVNEGGRGPGIWEAFSAKKGKIKNGDTPTHSCRFYEHYEADLEIARSLGFRQFRFSISWSRIYPSGFGKINEEGIAFYNRVIDHCISLGLEPWVTLYHWDLPLALEDLGGWKNRKIVNWFREYAVTCARAFGDRVRSWIVINEPMAVTGLGYVTGLHAPGKRGVWNFLPVVHHLALCQAEGGRAIREHVDNAYIGAAVSCSYVYPASEKPADVRAARRADAIMNRLFIEPALGLGYPVEAFTFLTQMKRYMLPGDEENLRFNFDFIGVQNYFSVVVRHTYLAPVIWLQEVPARLRNVRMTGMGWEINPHGLYLILKQYDAYEGTRDIIISENGAAFEDFVENGKVNDIDRRLYFQDYLKAVLKAKKEGVNVNGYFAWTLMDNFEWAEGYSARFGLVHVDFSTQKRIVKSSGEWFAKFLNVTH